MQTMWAGHMVGTPRLDLFEAPVQEFGEGQILAPLEGRRCDSDMPFYLRNLRHPALHLFPPPPEPLFSLHELVGSVAVSKWNFPKLWPGGFPEILALPSLPVRAGSSQWQASGANADGTSLLRLTASPSRAE